MATAESARASGSMPSVEPRARFGIPVVHKTKSSSSFRLGPSRPSSFRTPLRGNPGSTPLVPLNYKRQSLSAIRPLKVDDSPALVLEGKVEQLRTLPLQCILKTGRYFKGDGYSCISTKDSDELCAKLQSLAMILDTPNIFEYLSDDISEGILSVLSHDIFRSCTDAPPQFIFCDQIATITTCNKNVYLELYNILGKMIRNCKIDQFVKWLSPQILKNIVCCLDTPDAEEQAAVEGMIRALCTSFPDRRNQVYDYIMTRLQMCAHGLVPYHFVAPALRFIIDNQKSVLICPSDPFGYLNSIMPLFRSSFLPVFAAQMNEVSSLFYACFDFLPHHVLGYLFDHWPATDSSKVPCYLNHIGIIVPLLGSDTIQAVGKHVFSEISDAVASLNYKVAMAALNLLANRTFMSCFSDMGDVLFPIVYPFVIEKESYWHADVVRQAVTTHGVMRDLEPELCARLDKECSENVLVEAEMTFPVDEWTGILDAAVRTDPEISQEDVRARIELMRGQ